MVTIKKIFIPEEHAERVVLEDSFGNRSDHKYPLVVSVEVAPHQFEWREFDIDSAVEKELAIMQAREEKVREHARKRGHRHPAIEGEPAGSVAGRECGECE